MRLFLNSVTVLVEQSMSVSACPIEGFTMHHFRGILKDGQAPLLDPADVSIEYLGPQDGTRSNWNGYLLVPKDHSLRTGVVYTLLLADGRSGDLVIDHFAQDDTKADHLRAIFFSETPLA